MKLFKIYFSNIQRKTKSIGGFSITGGLLNNS